MGQPESKLSRRIQKAIQDQGWFCFKVHGTEHMMAGLPDIIVCAEGYFIGLEVKMPAQRHNVTKIQRFVHLMIRQSKGVAIVVCSPDEAIFEIKTTLEIKRNAR